jgi:hypothetical protein
MAVTPYLGIAHIASSQNQKEVTANAAFDQLDAAANAVLAVAMADADKVLSAASFTSSAVFECTGADTADRHLTVPNTMRVFIVNNKTTGGHNVIVKTAGSGGTVTVAAGTPQLVYCDGANNIVAVS